MFVRSFFVMFLLVGAGCVGHCGPWLDALDFRIEFPGQLSQSNRTVAQDALAQMGFTYSSGGPGGFFMVRDPVRVFVGDHAPGPDAPPVTTWTYEHAMEKRDYKSADDARETGHRRALDVWPAFNATLSDFESRTGWTAMRPATMEPAIVTC